MQQVSAVVDLLERLEAAGALDQRTALRYRTNFRARSALESAEDVADGVGGAGGAG